MLNTFLSFLAFYGVKSNIVVSMGPGALLFQKEKQYRKFRIINALLLMASMLLCLVATYFLNVYVYKPNEMEYLSVVVSVVIVGVANLVISKIFSKMSNFHHYLYEKSNSFATDFVFVLSAIFMADISLPVTSFLLSAAAMAIMTFVSIVVVGFFVEDANKSSVEASYQNVPSRLFMLAMVSILLYFAAQLIK